LLIFIPAFPLFLPPPFPSIVLFSPVSTSFSSLPSPQQLHLASPSLSCISHLVRKEHLTSRLDNYSWIKESIWN
ncbi:hypothetical protein LINPERHAP1_LOCUS21661, partial [Linum perenne]